MMKLLPLLALCLAPAPALPADPPAKPDLLVILTDQWSPRYLSWENPQVRTPALDQIAREGMIFDACYTTSPVCMPARISLITGLYPHNGGHSVWGNVQNYHIPADAAPMFRDIQSAGYTTAQIGKLHWFSGTAWKNEFATIEDYHRALGLDHVLDVSGPADSPAERGPYARHLKTLGLLGPVAADLHERYLQWEFEPRASLVKPEDYHDTFVTTQAIEFIGKQPGDKPLCIVLSLHSPHPPLDAPGEFATMFDPEKLTLPANVPEQFFREGHLLRHPDMRRLLANYLGKIALVDFNVGRIVAALKQRGTWENTLVAFTADHGEMMGAHGALTKGRFEEESARVPLVLRWPGHVQAGRTRALAQMFDVYPTLVEAAGAKLTPGRMAQSLLPVATGRKNSVREAVISEIGKDPPLGMMIREDRYKWWSDSRGEFLHDLLDDPLEMHNLAPDPAHAGTLGRMRERMLTQLRSTQLNLSEGYVPKVKRLREAEAAKGTAPEGKAGKKKKKQSPDP